MTQPVHLTPAEVEQVAGADYRYPQDAADHPFAYLPPDMRPILWGGPTYVHVSTVR